jgi:Flp pilus assembly pilin Flp
MRARWGTARAIPQELQRSGDMTLQAISLRLRRRDDGQDLIEYALLVALIAIVAVAAISAVGSAVLNSFWSVIAAGLSVS